MELFPPLANYTRQYMLISLNSAWNDLSNAEVLARAMDMVDRAAAEIEASEPEWWEVYVNLALVYQNAASLDPLVRRGRAGLRRDGRKAGARDPRGGIHESPAGEVRGGSQHALSALREEWFLGH